MESFKFLRSDFSIPIIKGLTRGNLAEPTIQFLREFSRSNGKEIITIHVSFSVKGLAFTNKFNFKSMSIFLVIDRDEIVASDVYDMQLKALADLQSYLDSSIGDNRVSIITPEIHTIMDQLVDFVREIKRSAL